MVTTLPRNKVIVTAALTGGLLGKAATPHIPLQPDEIAQTAYECYNEGAAIVHIHARDNEGKQTGSADVFREIHGKIRAKCNIILQDSTGGGPNLTMEQRLECLDACPEMASLNMGTIVRNLGAYDGTIFLNTTRDIEHFASRMKELGIKPEMEIYQPGMLRELTNLIRKGLVEKPYYIDLIFGMAYQGAIEADPRYLMMYLDLLPNDAIFNVLGVASHQNLLTTIGMILGGCVRVGLEDNLYYRRGELASNPQLVARAVRIARELGKEPVAPEEARRILGLKPLQMR